MAKEGDTVKRSESGGTTRRKRAPAKGASNLQAELARQIVEIAQDEAWTAGMHVPELALARRFGVSRSPVRAALELLARRDLLRLSPGEGFLLNRSLDATTDNTSLMPTSVGEDLYSLIMSERASGKLATQISEAELSARYRTTRGSVRRVLMRLATEGLAERLRGHGWRFAETLDTDAAIAESYNFRMAVECASFRQPGYKIDAARLQQLRRAHERILTLPANSVNRAEWYRVNASFHEALASWSGNRFILQAVRQQNRLRQITEYAEFPSLAPERIDQSCREHLGILDALQDGDLSFAEALLKRHLQLAGPQNEAAS
jgi:DNA-binding GntR family transcriptional regulator